MSALNSGVNERRGRGFFFATVSILDILSGATPHLVDVRQTVLTPESMTTMVDPPSAPSLRSDRDGGVTGRAAGTLSMPVTSTAPNSWTTPGQRARQAARPHGL